MKYFFLYRHLFYPQKYRYTYKSGINQGKQTDNNLTKDKKF